MSFALHICIVLGLLVVGSVSFPTSKTLEKGDLEAVLKTECPKQCKGLIENRYLAKLCTCVYRSGAFMYGKRRPSSGSVGVERHGENQPVSIHELARLLTKDSQKYSNVADQSEMSDEPNNIVREPMENSLKNTGDSTEKKQDVAAALQELLRVSDTQNNKDSADSNQQLASENEPLEELSTDLFKSEIGKDKEMARKEDYLKWVEKQLEIGERRMEKLLKFYNFIKLTSDLK